jgi:hypothetical protein
MTTKRVKTNLAGTTIEEFIHKCETYLLSLRKEVFSPIHQKAMDTTPKLERIKELQLQVLEGSHKAVMLRNELRKEITREMAVLCDWVNVHAHDDERLILECSFERVKPRSAATAPAGIRKLAVLRAEKTGKAQVIWKGNGSKFYRAQMTINPHLDSDWKDVATVTSTRCELDNLPVGTFCYFRVQGVNAAGPGEFSEVFMYMAS